MTNPYGAEPGPQPQGLGTPGSQGPQFIAPGSPFPYGSGQSPQPYAPQGVPFGQQPPTYGQQSPYGPPSWQGQQPYSQQPYAQGYGQPWGQGATPPPPPRRSSASGLVIVVVLVALVVGVAYGGYRLFQRTAVRPVTQPTPTRTITRAASGLPSASARPTESAAGTSLCMSGDTITTTDFVATVPESWSCDGDDGDISISSTRSDAIWVEHDTLTGDAAASCASQVQELGTVTALAQESWGGKKALSYQAVDGGDIYGIRCVVVGAQIWYLMYFPLDANDVDSVRADVTKVMSTWVWK